MTSEYDSMGSLVSLLQRGKFSQAQADQALEILQDFVQANHEMAHEHGNQTFRMPSKTDHFLSVYLSRRGGLWNNSIFRRADQLLREVGVP